MEFNRISPEKAGVKSEVITKLMDEFKKCGTEIHAMMMLKGNSIFAETYAKPYNKDTSHIMFSFTKSLTSTAIGFLIQEGKLALDDKLADIFSDLLPAEPSENLKKATVESLLTMSCGHEKEIVAFGMKDNEWIKAFLANPFVHEPGSYFMYNTAGTNMLSAILTRKTGEKLMDYLKPRLFDKLNMGEVYCYEMDDGTQMGGAGGFLTLSQMAKFIRFVANKGKWDGEQLLNEEWFNKACGNMIDNTPTQSNPDWVRGYGYQFWQCAPEGVFRADGAYGQYGIVIPQYDIVIIIQSASATMQDTLTCLWENFLPYVSDEPLPENAEACAVLKYVLDNNEIDHENSKTNPTAFEKFNELEIKDEKPLPELTTLIGGSGMTLCKHTESSDIEYIRIKIDDKNKLVVFECDNGETLPVSMNSHYNSFTLAGNTYGAVGSWLSEDVLRFSVRCAKAVSGRTFTLELGDEIKLSAVSSLPASGGLNDSDLGTIKFTRSGKDENGKRESTYKPYFVN